MYIIFFVLFLVYDYLLKNILLYKYISNLLPSGFVSMLKNKISILDIIKFIFSLQFINIFILVVLIFIIHILYFKITGSTIIDNNSSYLAIYNHSLFISLFFNFILCYVKNISFFSKNNIFYLFYSSILLFFVKITVFQTLPIISPILFFYIGEYMITKNSLELSLNVYKFLKSLFSYIPVFNKLYFCFNEKSHNYLNLELHKHKHIILFANKKRVFISKARLSIPIHLVSFNHKVNTLQVINPILKNTVVFKSFVLMSNKSFNSLKVFSISVCNYKNLNVSLIHIDKLGVLKNDFLNYKNNYLKITSLKSNLVKFEENIIIIYPKSFNFNNSNKSQALIRYADLITNNKNNYFLVSGSNSITKTAHNTDFFKNLNVLKKADIKFNSPINNYLNEVTSNIPYEMLNPIVFMMNNQDVNAMLKDKGKGVESIQDSYLPDAKSLERAFKNYKG